MFNLLSQNGKSAYGINDYFVDTEADIVTLPKSPDCSPGSSCFVRDGGKVFFLGHDNEWKEI